MVVHSGTRRLDLKNLVQLSTIWAYNESKVLGRLLLFTSLVPSFLRPWPNVEHNVNVCARNCSVIILNKGDGVYLAKEKNIFFED